MSLCPETDPQSDDKHLEQKAGRLHTVAVILIATVCVSIGETMLSAGMRRLGAGGHAGAGMISGAVRSPLVLGGTAFMAVYFALYSLALSWAEISFVLPFTALSYLFVAVMARTILHENVTPTRWLGTLIIILGVVVVGLGERGNRH